MKKARLRKGFTLIELLVVIVIIGLLATGALVGIPSYLEAGKQKNARDVCHQIRVAWTNFYMDQTFWVGSLAQGGVKEMDPDMCAILGEAGYLDVLYINEDGDVPAGLKKNKNNEAELDVGLLDPLGKEMYAQGRRGNAVEEHLYQFVLDVNGDGVIDGSDGLPAELNPGKGGIRATAAVWCWPENATDRKAGKTFAQSW